MLSSEDRLQGVPTIEARPGNSGNPSEAVTGFWDALLPMGGSWAGADERGVYFGALPPVPRKLAERIRAWEFMDIGELLPEFWAPRPDEKEGGQASSARHKRPVTELKMWLQCFAIYVAVISGKHPEVVPKLMSYM